MAEFIDCPGCHEQVKLIHGYYSLGGHQPECSFAGAKYNKNDHFAGRWPYPYQLKAINWSQRHPKFGLFWEMRLGKTLTLIQSFKRRNIQKVLVVCPKSVVPTWIDELKLEGINGLTIDTNLARNMGFALNSLKTWFVTNYETLIREDLSQYGWEGIVCDESHKLKDPRTKISNTLTGEDYRYIHNRACLTGTPAPENLLEYFQQLKFLFGSFAGCDTHYQFKSKFFYHLGGNQYAPKYGVENFLAKQLAEHCNVMKRIHAGIGGETIYEKREVEISGEYLQLYDDFERSWASEEYDTKYAIAAYQYLHQLSGGYHKKEKLTSDHKIKEVKDLLRNDLKGEQVVIWCKYRKELEAVKDEVSRYGPATDIHGDVHVEERHKRRIDFNNGKYRYLCCLIKAASQGLDMSGADTAIVFSNEFGSMYRSQMVDRLVHPEKKTPNLIIDIIAKGTVCEEVFHAVKAKQDNQDSFLKNIHQKLQEKYATSTATA